MKLISAFSLFLVAVVDLTAEPLSFDFADPKGVNTITFHLDGMLESISGNAKGITGRVQFDPNAPQNTSGSIQVDTASLYVSNPTMKDHLHGKNLMDVENNPDIRFNVFSLANVETTGNITTADVKGEITIKGVTRAISAKTTLTYLKGKLKARMGPSGPDGDLLVILTKFTVNRSDFGINAGQNLDKVSEEIEISLSIAGQAPY